MQPRFNLALRGARDTLPMLVGAAPFGVIFGTLAASSGLSIWATLAMSALVFAGASQFIALSLIASGAGLLVILLTTFVVNLRHMLYAASLLPLARGLSQRWLVPMAFWLTDESYAVVQHHLQSGGDRDPDWRWYFLGSAIAMYSTWVLATVAGMLLGHALPGMAEWGLDFAMVATFVGIVVPLLRSSPMLAAALAAVVVSITLHGLPYKLGLMLAALAGVTAGLGAAALGGNAQDIDTQGEERHERV